MICVYVSREQPFITALMFTPVLSSSRSSFHVGFITDYSVSKARKNNRAFLYWSNTNVIWYIASLCAYIF